MTTKAQASGFIIMVGVLLAGILTHPRAMKHTRWMSFPARATVWLGTFGI